jgi:hypothetical protein
VVYHGLQPALHTCAAEAIGVLSYSVFYYLALIVYPPGLVPSSCLKKKTGPTEGDDLQGCAGIRYGCLTVERRCQNLLLAWTVRKHDGFEVLCESPSVQLFSLRSIPNALHILEQDFLSAAIIKLRRPTVSVAGDSLSGFKGAVIFKKIRDARRPERVRRIVCR